MKDWTEVEFLIHKSIWDQCVQVGDLTGDYSKENHQHIILSSVAQMGIYSRYLRKKKQLETMF